jgi:hypothetical protein
MHDWKLFGIAGFECAVILALTGKDMVPVAEATPEGSDGLARGLGPRCKPKTPIPAAEFAEMLAHPLLLFMRSGDRELSDDQQRFFGTLEPSAGRLFLDKAREMNDRAQQQNAATVAKLELWGVRIARRDGRKEEKR